MEIYALAIGVSASRAGKVYSAWKRKKMNRMEAKADQLPST